MRQHRIFSPLTWPVYSFLAVILLGACALQLPASHMPGQTLRWVDAFFISTSAVCVTGLSPVDVGSVLSPLGQGILLLLIQTGGLGVMTYTSLIFLLWRRAVPFTSREAVTQALLGDTFDLRRFLREVAAITAGIEISAAVLLHCCDPAYFTPFRALFHAVSAFCNAGFALRPDNLVFYRDHAGVNAVICLAVILGGLGFTVLRETLGILSRGRVGAETACYSRFSRLVLKTSAALIVAGAALLFLIEWRRPGNELSVGDGTLLGMVSLFHSVVARTAGFNTIDMTAYSEASLLILCVLMFIGGCSGSTAGGIKITRLVILLKAGWAELLRTLHPRIVYSIRMGEREINPIIVGNITRFFFLYILVFIVLTILISLSGIPIMESMGLIAACMSSVGPAFGIVGPTSTYNCLSDWARFISIWAMILGRLEIFTLLVIMRPDFWRDKQNW